MKYIISLKNIILVFLSFFFFSCSEDGVQGEDGNVYLALTWASAPTFTTDDPAFPTSDYAYGTYYLSTAGTWTCAYVAWDGSLHGLTYTLTALPGTPGEEAPDPFTDGEDGEKGAPSCFEIYCSSFGPSWYDNQYCGMMEMTMDDDRYKNEIEKLERAGKTIDTYSNAQPLDYDLESISIDKNDPDAVVQTMRSGNYMLEVVSKRLN